MVQEAMLEDDYFHVLFDNCRDSAQYNVEAGIPAGEMVAPPWGPDRLPTFCRPDGTPYFPWMLP